MVFYLQTPTDKNYEDDHKIKCLMTSLFTKNCRKNVQPFYCKMKNEIGKERLTLNESKFICKSGNVKNYFCFEISGDRIFSYEILEEHLPMGLEIGKQSYGYLSVIIFVFSIALVFQ